MAGISRVSKNKQLGTLYEQKFVVECLERGLHPFHPVEDGLLQDFIVMNRDGTMFRIQVKGTNSTVQKNPRATRRYKVIAGYGQSSKERIDCEFIDILAAYAEPIDTWYIIPCEEISGLSVWMSPGSYKNRYEKFHESWSIFVN